MATGTVKESAAESKREEDGRLAVRRERLAAAARFELSRCEAGEGDAVLLAMRLLVEGREVLRQALEQAYGKDDAAPGPCPECGGRTRLLRVETARVETVLGSIRPRALRLASMAGSQASAQADELLRELSGLNFGAKRIERTTRAVGDDLVTRRWEAEAAEAAARVWWRARRCKPCYASGNWAIPRCLSQRGSCSGNSRTGSVLMPVRTVTAITGVAGHRLCRGRALIEWRGSSCQMAVGQETE